MAQWIVPLISTAISIISLFFALQTYYVSQRPYVGVFDINTQVEKDEKGIPTTIKWQSLIKNTGKVPALTVMEKHVCQVKKGELSVPTSTIGPVRKTGLILPDQITYLPGRISGEVLGIGVQDIFNGKVIFTCDIEFSYTTMSWWLKSKYVYQATTRFMPDFMGFFIDVGFAN